MNSETYDVFLSHSSADQDRIVTPLYDYLTSHDIKCFYSKECICGNSYTEVIPPAIRGSKVFFLVYTESANSSDQIKREAEIANAEHKQLYCMRCTDQPFNNTLRYVFALCNYFDATLSYDKRIYFDTILNQLKSHLHGNEQESKGANQQASSYHSEKLNESEQAKTCYFHTQEKAVSICGKCGVALCKECEEKALMRLDDGIGLPLCDRCSFSEAQNAVEYDKSWMEDRLVTIIIMAIFIVVGMVVFINNITGISKFISFFCFLVAGIACNINSAKENEGNGSFAKMLIGAVFSPIFLISSVVGFIRTFVRYKRDLQMLKTVKAAINN